MKLPFKHDIRVEPDKQLIISMGNYNGGSGPWVSLKVHTKEAMFIAQNLEKALEAGFYVPMDSCVFCGEKFTKTRGIVMLDEEKFAHLKCLRKEHKEGRVDFSDVKDWRKWFPNDAPKFEYSNLESKIDRIRYAVQVVSKTVIHFYVRPPGANNNKHFNLEQILSFTGGRQLLTITDVRKFTGLVDQRTIKKKFPYFVDNCISAATLARCMCGSIKK